MTEDIYRKVQEQLDQYSIGFPAAESGVEIEILKELFSEEEASLFAEMTGELETARSVAQRMNQPVEEVADKLENMALKGLLFRNRKDESVEYSAIPFIHGLLEFQALWMPKKLVSLTGKYIRERLKDNMAGGGGMRVLPIKESLDVKHRIASYDDACEVLRKEELLVITDCSCRLQRKLFDRACDSPMEACIMVGPMAQYYLDNKMGRKMSLDEAMEIVKECHAAGLVTQTSTVTRPFMICNCCKCCCGFLGAMRRTSKPAELVISNYRAEIDSDKCSGCEACIDRCQMQAITMNGESIAEIDYDRCIGCGLCISACPDDALSLITKSPEEHHAPNENIYEQMARLTKRRGIENINKKQIINFGFE